MNIVIGNLQSQVTDESKQSGSDLRQDVRGGFYNMNRNFTGKTSPYQSIGANQVE